MGDVLEFLVDGTSGLAPGGVSGTAIVTGVCSKGTVGKAYLLGKHSDLEGLLGVGPLVDTLKDVFATGGQEPVVIAVPVEGLSGGYIGSVRHTGSGPSATATGSPAGNLDAVLKIKTAGALGTATSELSLDGGKTFASAEATPANGQVTLGDSGATLILTDEEQKEGDTYSVTVRTPIGPVEKVGTGPDIDMSGTVKAAGELVLKIVKGGGRNQGTYQLSLDGGDSWDVERTLPADGLIAAGSTGVTITVPASNMAVGTVYTCRLAPPVPSISGVMAALEKPLERYDVEFVLIVGPSDSSDWAAAGAKADALWNLHRPTYFKMAYRLPQDGETVDDWTAACKAELDSYAHRFVQVCAAYGEVSDPSGKRLMRNWAGLQAGRVLSIPVCRATGRVKDGGISQGTLDEDFNEAHQKTLEKAGALTAKRYAGLSSAYWGDSRTLADPTSDFQYEEVVRTVFKAVRLSRMAALKSMYDEAGDPTLADNQGSGLNYLKACIEGAHGTMIAARPQELAASKVEIPAGQDIVNNGVAVEFTLIGLPIIREIRLFAQYVYAGSRQDPRLEVA
ncbi:DUF2586 domain-containing protein [Desulfoluna spongiiphila]|uniref:Phage tail sheath protein n=1 Tax=Desulfoluna spongiiphila TaxID=419481 RepID=A0A1G5JIK6_9BACT|nr:DUF2586 domain-containing protein [Desulfoluna spongiiphila]SCY88195.1 Protein of unknown function [Desulfoluna spongiiphila]